jgi:hypothetical protein
MQVSAGDLEFAQPGRLFLESDLVFGRLATGLVTAVQFIGAVVEEDVLRDVAEVGRGFSRRCDG